MAEVKAERATLMSSLAALKSGTSRGGGDLQQDDIFQLRGDLKLKLQKLNHLKRVCMSPCLSANSPLAAVLFEH